MDRLDFVEDSMPFAGMKQEVNRLTAPLQVRLVLYPCALLVLEESLSDDEFVDRFGDLPRIADHPFVPRATGVVEVGEEASAPGQTRLICFKVRDRRGPHGVY